MTYLGKQFPDKKVLEYIALREIFYPKEQCPDGMPDERIGFFRVDSALWKAFYRDHPESIGHESSRIMRESSQYVGDHITKCGVCHRRYEALGIIDKLVVGNKLPS